jgi:excisionase family DNA binding protein
MLKELTEARRKLLLTPVEAAHMLSIDRSTLYDLLMNGEIPSIKIGRARRIPVRALERWVGEQMSV